MLVSALREIQRGKVRSKLVTLAIQDRKGLWK